MDGVVPVVSPLRELNHRRSYNWIKVLTSTTGSHQEERIGTAQAGFSPDRRRPSIPGLKR